MSYDEMRFYFDLQSPLFRFYNLLISLNLGKNIIYNLLKNTRVHRNRKNSSGKNRTKIDLGKIYPET